MPAFDTALFVLAYLLLAILALRSLRRRAASPVRRR